MTTPTWPDSLQPPDPARLAHVLEAYWQTLAVLAELLEREEYLLAEECLAQARGQVLEVMLGMNGIAPPRQTRNLNGYLGPSQREALERTLRCVGGGRDPWIGRAIALTTIYRWYAPQVVERYGVAYPQAAEDASWRELTTRLAEWPLALTTS